MFEEFREIVSGQVENLSRQMETIKKNQMEILELQFTVLGDGRRKSELEA